MYRLHALKYRNYLDIARIHVINLHLPQMNNMFLKTLDFLFVHPETVLTKYLAFLPILTAGKIDCRKCFSNTGWINVFSASNLAYLFSAFSCSSSEFISFTALESFVFLSNCFRSGFNHFAPYHFSAFSTKVGIAR